VPTTPERVKNQSYWDRFISPTKQILTVESEGFITPTKNTSNVHNSPNNMIQLSKRADHVNSIKYTNNAIDSSFEEGIKWPEWMTKQTPNLPRINLQKSLEKMSGKIQTAFSTTNAETNDSLAEPVEEVLDSEYTLAECNIWGDVDNVRLYPSLSRSSEYIAQQTRQKPRNVIVNSVNNIILSKSSGGDSYDE
jgi:hypothetical protein